MNLFKMKDKRERKERARYTNQSPAAAVSTPEKAEAVSFAGSSADGGAFCTETALPRSDASASLLCAALGDLAGCKAAAISNCMLNPMPENGTSEGDVLMSDMSVSDVSAADVPESDVSAGVAVAADAPESDVPAGVAAVGDAPDDTPAPDPVDAVVYINISRDRMSANMILSPPLHDGAPVSEAAIRFALESMEIVFGINEPMIRAIVNHPQYAKSFEIARGRFPVDGKPARIEYKVDVNKVLRPKENPDGTVDFKDLDFVHNVVENELLCVKIPPGEGVPGSDVTGKALPSNPGKDIALPMGSNTKTSEDQMQLLAACNGQVDLVGQKLHVYQILTIDGDVGVTTGNIDFVGNLVIKGSILSGFVAKAGGNITVSGSIDDATVIAGGNIVIKGGINGGGQSSKHIVQTGGALNTKYIQNARVYADGNIESTFIHHSVVKSKGKINVYGSKGRMIGGKVSAQNEINTPYAGWRDNDVLTILEVGNDPDVLNRKDQLEREITMVVKQMDLLKPVMTVLEEKDKSGSLPHFKQLSISDARTAYASMDSSLYRLEQELHDVKENAAALGRGAVNIKRTASPGVRIVIGDDQMDLRAMYENTTFTRGEDGIYFVPCTA